MKIVFLGSTEFGYNCCKEIIRQGHNILKIYTSAKSFNISYSDKPVKNYLHIDFTDFSKKYNIPVKEISDGFSSKDYFEEIKSLSPDLIIVIGWYYMVPKKIREIAPKGCIGIHASLLPKYRGGAPLNWAMINGEKKAGVSLFYLEGGVDDGDLINQKEIIIEPEDDISNIRKKAEIFSVEMLSESLPLIENNTVKPIKQDESKATYVPQRKPEDGLIDWSKSPEEIKNFIRAQTKPYPGAFTIINNKKITIWDADIQLSENKSENKPDDVPLALSFDTDWCPEEILEDTLNLLKQYDVKATFFMTGKYNSLDLSNHELAIHPNIKSLDSAEQEIQKLKDLFPKSKGIRNHGLLNGSRLLSLYEKYHLSYSSNYILFDQSNVKKTKLMKNITEIPIYFEDDIHAEMNSSDESDEENLWSLKYLKNLNSKGIKLFNFHPIHVFLNTPSIEFYEKSKKYYHNFEKLSSLKNTSVKGARDILIELLEYAKSNNISFHMLNQFI
jgi:methionyl-tRNA formyltransferase